LDQRDRQANTIVQAMGMSASPVHEQVNNGPLNNRLDRRSA
jgi:hypothetical protein